jgi:hypothetical protein
VNYNNFIKIFQKKYTMGKSGISDYIWYIALIVITIFLVITINTITEKQTNSNLTCQQNLNSLKNNIENCLKHSSDNIKNSSCEKNYCYIEFEKDGKLYQIYLKQVK